MLRLPAGIVLDSLSVSDCAVYNIQQSETGAEYTTISWQQQGAPEVIVEYGPTGFAPGNGTVVTTNTSPLTI